MSRLANFACRSNRRTCGAPDRVPNHDCSRKCVIGEWCLSDDGVRWRRCRPRPARIDRLHPERVRDTRRQTTKCSERRGAHTVRVGRPRRSCIRRILDDVIGDRFATIVLRSIPIEIHLSWSSTRNDVDRCAWRNWRPWCVGIGNRRGIARAVSVAGAHPELVCNPVSQTSDRAQRAVSMRFGPCRPCRSVIGRVLDDVVRNDCATVVLRCTPTNRDIARTDLRVVNTTRWAGDSWRNGSR